MSLVAAYFCHISLVLSHVVELFSSVMNWHREQVLHRQVSSNVILFLNLVYLFCIQFVSWFKETNWSPAGLCTPDLLEKKGYSCSSCRSISPGFSSMPWQCRGQSRLGFYF